MLDLDLALRNACRPDRTPAGNHAGHRTAGRGLRPVPVGHRSSSLEVHQDDFRCRRSSHGGHDGYHPERLPYRILARARGRVQLSVQRAGHRVCHSAGVGLAQVAARLRHGSGRRRALRLRRSGSGVLRVGADIPLRTERRRAERGAQEPALGGAGKSRHRADEESAHRVGLSVGDDGARRHRGGRPVHVPLGQHRGAGRRRRRGRCAIPSVVALCHYASVRGRMVVRIRRHPGPHQPRCGAGAGSGAVGGGLRLDVLRKLAA